MAPNRGYQPRPDHGTHPASFCTFSKCTATTSDGAALCARHLALFGFRPRKQNAPFAPAQHDRGAQSKPQDDASSRYATSSNINGTVNSNANGIHDNDRTNDKTTFINGTGATNGSSAGNKDTSAAANPTASSTPGGPRSKSPFLRRKTAPSGRIPSISSATAGAPPPPAPGPAIISSGSPTRPQQYRDPVGGAASAQTPSASPRTAVYDISLSRKRSRADFQESGQLNTFSLRPRNASGIEGSSVEGGHLAPTSSISNGATRLLVNGDSSSNSQPAKAANGVTSHEHRRGSGDPVTRQDTGSTPTLNPGVKDWWLADRSKRIRASTEEAAAAAARASAAETRLPDESRQQVERERRQEEGPSRGTSTSIRLSSSSSPVPATASSALHLSSLLYGTDQSRIRDYERLAPLVLGGSPVDVGAEPGDASSFFRPAPAFSMDTQIYTQEGAAPPPPGVTVPTLAESAEILAAASADNEISARGGGGGGFLPSTMRRHSLSLPPASPPSSSYLYVLLHDPRKHWPRSWSREWHIAKQKEIKARGGRKANFGKVAERMAERRRKDVNSSSSSNITNGSSTTETNGNGGASTPKRGTSSPGPAGRRSNGATSNGTPMTNGITNGTHHHVNNRPTTPGGGGAALASSPNGTPTEKEDYPPEVQSNGDWMGMLSLLDRQDDEFRKSRPS